MIFFTSWKNKLRKDRLLRETVSVSGRHGPVIEVAGRKLLNFASNNYLGLAGDPRVDEAVKRTLRVTGWGSGAARLLSGSNRYHEELEERIAAFKSRPRALLFGSGYLANIGTLPVVAAPEARIFSDACNHASVIDGIRLSTASVRIYAHGAVEALGASWNEARDLRRIIVTDGLFSMDGDLAPLSALYDLMDRPDDLLYLDDAHGTGVIGPDGRGTDALFGLQDDRLVTMGTLSKGLGGVGAFVVGSADLIDVLRSRARSFIFTTAVPAPVCAASLAALDLIEQEGEELRAKLRKNCGKLHQGLKAVGFDSDPGTPIFPVVLGEAERALKVAAELDRAGIFAPAIRPPTVPSDGCRIRFSAMATHTEEQIDRLLDALAAAL